MQKGRLLFKLATAEDKGENKALIALSGVLLVVVCVVFYCVGNKYLFDSTYKDDENTVFYILSLIMLFSISAFIVWCFNERKKADASKLYLYENCVEGTTQTKSSGFGVTLENFCLSYADIINVSSMDRFVIIYTQWQSYKILAFNKHYEIIKIINEQKEKIKQ